MIKKLFTINKKGITITSLTIYVIVATIIVGILVFLNANFFSNINDLTNKANIVSECLNFKSAFLRDIKSENNVKVTEFNNNMIRLSNDIKYEIRALDTGIGEKKYAIYRNDVQIAKSIVAHTTIDGQQVKEGPYFEYDVNTNTVRVGIKFTDGKNTYVENESYIVGKGMQVAWSNDSHNTYVPIPSGDITEPSGDNPPVIEVPEEERVYAVLYDDGTLEIANSSAVNSGKEILKNYGEISTSIKEGNPLWLANNTKIVTANFKEAIKLTTLKNLFAGCTNLRMIQNTQNVDVSNAITAENAFQGCSKLVSIDISNWNTENVVNMSKMFDGCSSLITLNLNTFKTTNVEDMSEMFNGCTSLKQLDMSSCTTSNLKNIDNMFANCTSLVSLNINNFDTNDVNRMKGLFYNCQNLQSLNIGTFNIDNVTDLSYLFYNCRNISSITLAGMDTSNVTDMSYMFANCAKLNKIDLENFNPVSVVNMEGMFYCCESFEQFDFNKFNTPKVENMSKMFYGCIKLSEFLNISSIKTESVTNMAEMFKNCSSLRSLDLRSANFDTSKVTNMSDMFSGCSLLYEIYVDTFSTENVTNMAGMFESCSSLTNLNLKNFNTANVINMVQMFQDDANLTKIEVSNLWNEEKADTTNMLKGCGTTVLTKV